MSVKKYNKTESIKENTSLVSCKPFVASSILFLLVSVITVKAFIFYVKAFYINLQPKKITRLLLKKKIINNLSSFLLKT